MKNLEAVRESIIEAAEKHFSILGFEKTTLDDIAGDNGKSKTSVYYHFKNKHDIFKNVISKEFSQVMKDIKSALETKGKDRTEAMRTYLKSRFESIQRQGAYRRFASSRYVFGSNPISKAVTEARRQFDNWEREYLETSVRNGVSEGTIRPGISPEIFAATLMNILKALEIQFLSSDNKEEVSDTYNRMIELLIR